MGEVPMPGGWMLSMAWMPMCGQTWAGTAASFVGMWTWMMAAMMLPSLAPLLWRYSRDAGAQGSLRATGLAAQVGAGYLLVWIGIGAVIFALGAVLAQAAMHMPSAAHAMPVAAALVVLAAAAFQLSKRKAQHLAWCRSAAGPCANARAAWEHGLRLGLHCGHACAGLTALLVVMGVMDLRAMIAVTAAISAERLAPAGESIARAIGGVAAVAGIVMMGRAVGLA